MERTDGTGGGLVAFTRMVLARFVEDRCMSIASSLTFTTLLAIVPTITIALTLIPAFPVFREASDHLEMFLMENLIPESAASIATYAEQFTENAGKLTAVGLVFLFVTAMIVLMTIDRALNGIWRVARPRPPARRVFIYLALLTVGPVLVGISLSLTSWVVSVSLGLVRDVPYAARVLLRVVPVVLTGIAFAMLYATLPNRRVMLRDALIGGLLAGVVFEATKHGFAFYVTRFPTYKLVYGAFAAVPIFLIWIYLSWLVVLLGAVAAAVLPEWRQRTFRVEAAPGARFLDALQILRVLRESQDTGVVVDERRLHAVVKVPAHDIEAILHAMRALGWVCRVAGGWALARDPARLKVGALYDLFVFRGDPALPVRQSGRELDRLALRYAVCRIEDMELSVAALLLRASSASAPDPSTAGGEQTAAASGPPAARSVSGSRPAA